MTNSSSLDRENIPASAPVPKEISDPGLSAAQMTKTPASLAEARIAITPAMLQELNAKLNALGNPGQCRIMQAVDAYERAEGLAPSGLSEDNIKYAIKKNPRSINKIYWDRIHAALDKMSANHSRARRESITVTAALHQDLLARIHAKGGIRSKHIMHVIKKYETATRLQNTGLKEQTVGRLIRAAGATLPQQQWERLLLSLDNLPDRAVRVPIPDPARQELLALHKKKGKPGAARIRAAVRNYEKSHGLPPSELSFDMIVNVISGKLGTLRSGYLERLRDGLTTLNTRIPVTKTIHKQFLAGIKAIKRVKKTAGDMSDSVLTIQAVTDYERKKGLEPVGLTNSIVYDVLRGKQRSLEQRQRDRIKQALKAAAARCTAHRPAKILAGRKPGHPLRAGITRSNSQKTPCQPAPV
ncbi:MAG: hypothetical protein WBK91_08115 [Alphaproteobacteria bacterium]